MVGVYDDVERPAKAAAAGDSGARGGREFRC